MTAIQYSVIVAVVILVLYKRTTKGSESSLWTKENILDDLKIKEQITFPVPAETLKKIKVQIEGIKAKTKSLSTHTPTNNLSSGVINELQDGMEKYIGWIYGIIRNLIAVGEPLHNVIEMENEEYHPSTILSSQFKRFMELAPDADTYDNNIYELEVKEVTEFNDLANSLLKVYVDRYTVIAKL